MSTAVFTYGTLMFPPVWHAVTGSFAFGMAGRLQGFSRYALRGRSYPGLIEEPAGVVEGVLHPDVDEVTLSRLDAFEGAEYERVEVMVETETGDQKAVTYVLSPRCRVALEDSPWIPERFAPHLARFLGTRS